MRTLAFIAFVERAKPAERHAIQQRAKQGLSKSENDELNGPLVTNCTQVEIDYRVVRLEYGIAKRWTQDEASGMQSAIRFAITALLLGDRVSVETRNGTLSVFGTSLDDLDAMSILATKMPTDDPSGPEDSSACKHIDGRAIEAITADYPPESGERGIHGNIKVTLSLDNHGYVRTATLFDKAIQPPGASGDELVTAAIEAAGASLFAPEFVACKAVAGKYIFRAEFSTRVQ